MPFRVRSICILAFAALLPAAAARPALAQSGVASRVSVSADPEVLTRAARDRREAGDHAAASEAFAEAGHALIMAGDAVGAAEAFTESARSRLALGDVDGAYAVLAEAAERLEASGPGAHAAAGRATASLARIRTNQGRYAEALILLDRSEALAGDILDGEGQAALAYDRARILEFLGRAEDSENHARRALALRREHLGETDSRTADALNQLAVSLQAQGRYDEADRAYRDALAVYEAANGPEHPKVAIALSNLGNILRRRDRESAAEPVYRRAIRIAEASGDEELLAQCLTNLGWHLRMTGRSPDADPLFRRAADLLVEVAGPDHPFTGIAFANLALILGDQDKHGEAALLFVRALAALEPALGADSPDLLTTLDGYALTLARLDRQAEAESVYARTLDIARTRLSPGHPEATRQTVAVAGFLLEDGRAAEARLRLGEAEMALFQRIGTGAGLQAETLRRTHALFERQVYADWALAHEVHAENSLIPNP
jgi:tetratricopeptide (TPR) repeat protein